MASLKAEKPVASQPAVGQTKKEPAKCCEQTCGEAKAAPPPAAKPVLPPAAKATPSPAAKRSGELKAPSSVTKPAPRKAEQKPREPKKEVKGGKPPGAKN